MKEVKFVMQVTGILQVEDEADANELLEKQQVEIAAARYVGSDGETIKTKVTRSTVADNESLVSRLMDAKFTSAIKYIDGRVSENDRAVIYALAATFGNTGIVFGTMGDIIGAAVRSLIGTEDGG